MVGSMAAPRISSLRRAFAPCLHPPHHPLSDPAHRVDAAPPRLLRGEIDGATVTLTFSEALDPDATGGRFLMGIQTSESQSLGCHATGEVAVDGETVTVRLGDGCPPARAGLTEDNDLKYLRRADGADGSFRDLAGNLLATDGDAGVGLYVQIALENVTGRPPRVTGVAVVSDAGDDDTYALGEKIRVAVTFSKAVEVDTAGGAPSLSIDMDPADWGEKRAQYAGGSGGDTLVFVHEAFHRPYKRLGVEKGDGTAQREPMGSLEMEPARTPKGIDRGLGL